MAKLSLKDLSLKGKRVLMRVDFNVPLEKGVIADDSRIRASLPSIEYILDQGASLVLMSHLGKPKGKPEAGFSLAPCAKRLSELLERPVQIATDCVGPEAEAMAKALQPGQVLLLENLRFHIGEEDPEKDLAFAEKLARLGDTYVNDAFGTAHRSHSSTATICRYFPNQAAMGFLIEKEIEALSPLLENPKRPFYAIVGGAKISSKLGVIQKLLDRVDALFIGGAMAYTFFKAQGIKVGDSLVEDISIIRDLPKEKLHFPVDLVISKEQEMKVVLVKEGIPSGWQGMDIGPETVTEWAKSLSQAATIFWNGPLGVFEMPQFAKGTQKIAELLAKGKAKTIIGGGDSVAAIEGMGLQKKFAHLSTGGGAALEFLEYGHLPGIDALSNKY